MDSGIENILGEIVGIVCARDGSQRLKDKNSRMIGNETLVSRACRTLYQAGIKEIYCATNIPKKKARLPVHATYVMRDESQSEASIPLQETVKWVVDGHKLQERFKYIATLMPNCPFIMPHIVRNSMELLAKGKKIVRTYNFDGDENGLILADLGYYMDNISDVYTGSVHVFGFEIHDIADYARASEILTKI